MGRSSKASGHEAERSARDGVERVAPGRDEGRSRARCECCRRSSRCACSTSGCAGRCSRTRASPTSASALLDSRQSSSSDGRSGLVPRVEPRHAGVTIRLSRAVNTAMSRRFGKVFADRHHAHVLKTPTEARNALRYVFENHKKHMAAAGRSLARDLIDPHSSAPYHLGREANPLPSPSSRLLRSGYLCAGP
jgi:hypothetical protein